MLLLLIFLALIGALVWYLNRPAKRVIVTPISQNGAVSPQSFLATKSVWDVVWGSDTVNFIRILLDLLGLAMLAAWLWG